MSGSSDPFDRLVEPGAERQVSRLEPGVKDWLLETGADLNSIVRVEMVREHHPERWRDLLDAVTDEHDRSVLVAVYQEGGTATYEQVNSWTRLSDYRTRERVKALEEADILERTRSRYVTVSWADEVMSVLGPDALSFYLGTV